MGLHLLHRHDRQATENEPPQVYKTTVNCSWGALVDKGYKMFPKINLPSVILTISLVLVLAFIFSPAQNIIQAKGASPTSLWDFEHYVKSIGSGKPGDVQGVYAPGVFAAKVLQQPADNPGYVSPLNGAVTEFATPKSFGNIGLLAHNYLTGAEFSKLTLGQVIRIVYGDGKVESFVVKEILQYQALQPDSAYSILIDLETGQSASASKVFKRVYSGKRHLTLQTCIYADGDPNWGRLFVIATPIE